MFWPWYNPIEKDETSKQQERGWPSDRFYGVGSEVIRILDGGTKETAPGGGGYRFAPILIIENKYLLEYSSFFASLTLFSSFMSAR